MPPPVGTTQPQRTAIQPDAPPPPPAAPPPPPADPEPVRVEVGERELRQQATGGRAGRTARPSGLDYDTAHYSLRPRTVPSDPAQRTALDTQLRSDLDGIYGRGNWSVTGATAGSDDEIRGMDALRQYGRTQRNGTPIDHRGTESDLLVPGSGGASTMRMTTQMDRSGRIAGNVHPTTGAPASASTFATAADAQAALQRDFGVTVAAQNTSDPNSRAFTAGELGQLHGSLSQLSADERTQLRGLEFWREANPPSTEPANTAGLYSSNTATSNGTRVRPQSITYYDRAFSGNAEGFVGSSTTAHPDSSKVLLHEVGHAIEDRSANDAAVALNGSVDSRNAASGRFNTANQALQQPLTDMNSESRTFVRTANSITQTRPQQRQTTAFNTASNDVVSALNDLNRATTAQQRERAEARLTRATTARDRALTDMGSGHPLFSAGTSLVGRQDAAITAARPAAERQVEYQQAVGEQARMQRAYDRAAPGGTSARLTSFQGPLRRDLSPTEYGRTSAAEAFAESYMLYRSDPEYLRANRPHIYQWFADGNHTR